MKTDVLDYELPESSIAQRPTEARDGGRLMVVRRELIEHAQMVDFEALVPEKSLVVVNDTRVLRARLLGARRETGGRAEIFLLRALEAPDEPGRQTWRALGRANRPLRAGARVAVGELAVTILACNEDGTLDVELRAPIPIDAAIEAYGAVPLPPYVRRDEEPDDRARYQTVFAKSTGSVAAPTAGLHLTERFLDALRRKGVAVGRVTLHVGLGTFRPVTVGDLDDHPMHEEEYVVSDVLARQVAEARERGAAVVAIGTTVVRALESARDPSDPRLIVPTSGATRLMIQPGYTFGPVDALLTNFHMPRSTLLALVGAFCGLERLLSAYEEALKRGYRFLSYGDAMWIPERCS